MKIEIGQFAGDSLVATDENGDPVEVDWNIDNLLEKVENKHPDADIEFVTEDIDDPFKLDLEGEL